MFPGGEQGRWGRTDLGSERGTGLGTDTEGPARAYAYRVGQRLRAIRRQKGLSLQEVESTSSQEFKASVLGAYERGERIISVSRLQRLAGLYNVPVDQLLPGATERVGDVANGSDDGPVNGGPSGALPEKVTFDLTRIDAVADAELEMLCRYLTSIVMQRQDFNGRMLTIRGDDMRTMAGLMGIDARDLLCRLDAMQLRVTPDA